MTWGAAGNVETGCGPCADGGRLGNALTMKSTNALTCCGFNGPPSDSANAGIIDPARPYVIQVRQCSAVVGCGKVRKSGTAAARKCEL